MSEETVTITQETRVPIGWMISGLIGAMGAVLFLADIRSQSQINNAGMITIEKRVSVLERDLKEELRSIRAELVKMNQSNK